ncbi:MAG TPA: preprotein translocase subunit SecG [Tepidisphaeraceae bacterium]|jgi:preprotein translocase subunit SecG
MLLATWVYSAFLGLFITLFIIISVLMILIVLIQKGRGGGLASAFGGGGGNTAFGSKTGDVLTWATSIIFGIFVVLAVILNLMTQSGNRPASVAGGGTQQNVPANPTPAPAPQTSTPSSATPPAPTVIPPQGGAPRPAATQGK